MLSKEQATQIADDLVSANKDAGNLHVPLLFRCAKLSLIPRHLQIKLVHTAKNSVYKNWPNQLKVFAVFIVAIAAWWAVSAEPGKSEAFFVSKTFFVPVNIGFWLWAIANVLQVRHRIKKALDAYIARQGAERNIELKT